MPLPSAPTDDVFDPDDVGLSNSPPLEPMKVNLHPSPSPPAIPLPPPVSSSSESSPDPEEHKGSNRLQPPPSMGDRVLVSFLAGGRHPDIAQDAGNKPLALESEEVEEAPKNLKMERRPVSDPEPHGAATEEVCEEAKGYQGDQAGTEKDDLMAVAAGAINTLRQTTNATTISQDTNGAVAIKQEQLEPGVAASGGGEPMEGVEGAKPSIPPITTIYTDSLKPTDASPKLEMKIPATGELPPFRPRSPQSSLSNGNGAGPITLPSITDQLGDINHLAEASTPAEPTFAQSPPGRPVPRFPAVPGHGSPPKSPSDTFRRELPSPGRGYYFGANGANGARRPSQTDGHQYPSPADYSSSNTETPSTDQSGTTPTTVGIDRMSIDGITNPQIGGFHCTYLGCTAQPFQTQYLLNSHANVHSSNRPHYCSVKGCPRSEGGKGFKRKNEMIRHGLVHDSPGYVCPFCPDREHKYPRPDNLQRHVRVHHVDKDKDDPQLRDVLSQRPEGPSRGRRRRGGTNS